MRVSTKFSDTIHLLAFISVYQDIHITSAVIAVSINTSPVVVRRLIGTLKEAGVVTTDVETHNPTFAKSPEEITLLDIYLLTEGHTPLFALDKETNPLCIVGANIQDVLTGIYHEAETAALMELNRHTMQDVIDRLLTADKVKKAQAASA